MQRLTRWIVAAVAAAAPITVCLTVAIAPPAMAQDAADLPSAEKVLERYIEATGGRAAYDKLKNRVTRGTMEIPSMGMKGEMVVTQAAPNKMVVKMQIPNIGSSVNGFDGEHAWESSEMMGSRLLDGAELSMFKRQAMFNPELNWREVYSSVKTVGTEDIDGKPAYKVELTTLEGDTLTQFYDKDSGLIVKNVMIAKTQMGDVPVETRVVEYKEFDGIKVPVKSTQSMMGMQQQMTLQSVEHNVTLDADAFAPPEDVKTLIEEKAKAE